MPFKLKRYITAVSATLVLALSPMAAMADKVPALVMFTANWCASCRDVLPAVQAHAQQKGYALILIDVDSAGAQARARQYGLNLDAISPPMVYWFKAGASQLLINEATDPANTAKTLENAQP